MLEKMTIALRLKLGFGLFFIMLLAAVVLGLNRLGAVDEMVERIVTRDWQKTVLANDAIDLMNDTSRASFEMFHSTDRKAQAERIARNREAITQKLEALEKILYKPEGKLALAEIGEKRKAYVASYGSALRLLESGKDGEA